MAGRGAVCTCTRGLPRCPPPCWGWWLRPPPHRPARPWVATLCREGRPPPRPPHRPSLRWPSGVVGAGAGAWGSALLEPAGGTKLGLLGAHPGAEGQREAVSHESPLTLLSQPLESRLPRLRTGAEDTGDRGRWLGGPALPPPPVSTATVALSPHLCTFWGVRLSGRGQRGGHYPASVPEGSPTPGLRGGRGCPNCLNRRPRPPPPSVAPGHADPSPPSPHPAPPEQALPRCSLCPAKSPYVLGCSSNSTSSGKPSPRASSTASPRHRTTPSIWHGCP